MARRYRKYMAESLPNLKFSRNRFDLSHSVTTTFNTGDLVPLESMLLYPGDTIRCKDNHLIRLTSPLVRPGMINLFFDEFTFFVPYKLVYKDFDKLIGGSEPDDYSSPADGLYEIETDADQGIDGSFVGGVFDHLGLPIFYDDRTSQGRTAGVNSMECRAFALIWNNWFRDENIQNSVDVPIDSSFDLPNNNAWSETNFTGKLPKVNKIKDYFTSLLPSPQKGVAPNIPVTFAADVPVTTGSTVPLSGGVAMTLQPPTGSVWSFPGGTSVRSSSVSATPSSPWTAFKNLPSLYGSAATGSRTPVPFAAVDYSTWTSTTGQVPELTPGTNPGFVNLEPANLWARTSKLDGIGVTANSLRDIFSIQRYLEKMAMYGGRYTEWLLANFGVSTGDIELQIPEYVGGRRSPITIQEVAQTSNVSESPTPLASLAAFSKSSGTGTFTYTAKQHGFLITVGCVRELHNYSQFLHPDKFKNSRYDFYSPVFARLGLQPVYTKEIVGISQDQDVFVASDQILGYKEPWAELRQGFNVVNGHARYPAFSIDKSGDLSIWVSQDVYTSVPSLTSAFIQETPANLDRLLTIPSTSQDQFILNLYRKIDAWRVAPLYSIPSNIGG